MGASLLVSFFVGLVATAVFVSLAIRFRRQCRLLEGELQASRTKHAEDLKQWEEYGVRLRTECQKLAERSVQLERDLDVLKGKYAEESRQWNEYAARLKAELQRLSQYRGVADADAKAKQLLAEAQAALEKAAIDSGAAITEARARADKLTQESRATVNAATVKAQQILGEARTRAQEIGAAAQEAAKSVNAAAREQAKKLKDEAQATLDSAVTRAANIVAEANKRAEEIAGSAYEAMNNTAFYERAVKAMKNIIDGYGDQYLVPAHSLLDDVAEEMGNTEAAQELKRARDRSRAMIRSGTAAHCDYVETSRRETAIDFVIDAFNGKVDSILSRVKEDNAGTLSQEIRDAFTLVNLNGKAFRGARVSEEYLASRLDELKWAAIVQHLKLQDREEQRRLREQIREEEKARREYERAIREAAKEEELLRKAMEKARQQMDQANAEERNRYEQQLQELSEKLKQAEERNQRALSMAQQTRRGHVYIISNIGSFGEDVYKIGLTRRLEPLDRIRELGDSSVPFDFDVHALVFSEDAPALETALHKHFVLMQVNKVNHRKEFFRVPLIQIREELETLGLEAKWTMTAEARQYRETQAIEKAIAEDPGKRDAWLSRQLELEVVEELMPEPEAVEA